LSDPSLSPTCSVRPHFSEKKKTMKIERKKNPEIERETQEEVRRRCQKFFHIRNFRTFLHRTLEESPDCQPTLTSGSLASRIT